MVHGTALVLAGAALTAAAAGGGIYILRRRKKAAALAAAPSVMPPQLAQSGPLSVVKPSTLIKPSLLAAMESIKEAQKAAYYKLTAPERQFVIASSYLKEQLALVVATASQPFEHYSGNDEIAMRWTFYSKLVGQFLARWPLLFDVRSRVVHVAYKNTPPNYPNSPITTHIIEDIQIPPPQIPGWAPGWGSKKLLDTSINDFDQKPPPKWFAAKMHDQIAVAQSHVTGKPWNPDLPTAGHPPEWVIDAGRAIVDALGGDKYKAGELAQKAAKESLEGAERVFGKAPSHAQMKLWTDQAIANVVDMVALCELYERYRWW